MEDGRWKRMGSERSGVTQCKAGQGGRVIEEGGGSKMQDGRGGESINDGRGLRKEGVQGLGGKRIKNG